MELDLLKIFIINELKDLFSAEQQKPGARLCFTWDEVKRGEVYGSSVSFVSCVSAYLNIANAPIAVFCEYQIPDDEGQFRRVAVDAGQSHAGSAASLRRTSLF